MLIRALPLPSSAGSQINGQLTIPKISEQRHLAHKYLAVATSARTYMGDLILSTQHTHRVLGQPLYERGAFLYGQHLHRLIYGLLCGCAGVLIVHVDQLVEHGGYLTDEIVLLR